LSVIVAVTGASGLVGQRLLGALAERPDVDRIIGIDVREPQRRVRKLEFHRVDVASADLKPLLEGVTVLMHLAAIVDPIPDESLMARVNIEGTRHVLDAAAAVGVKRVVRVSSSSVYGAWANNPVPLTEDAPLRPNPSFTPAVQAAEAERILTEWRSDHPGVHVATLRAAPVAGPGAERLMTRLLLGRPALRVRGATPAVQMLHVDDLVAAVLLAMDQLDGTYNVAPDGWLGGDDLLELTGRGPWPAIPAEALDRVLNRGWSAGLGDVPPGVVPYLSHPWVIANDRLRAQGWAPEYSNAESVVVGLESLPPQSNPRAAFAVVAAAGLAAAGLAAGWWGRRRRRRR
jgi:UDP-glucose 4-epimerase